MYINFRLEHEVFKLIAEKKEFEAWKILEKNQNIIIANGNITPFLAACYYGCFNLVESLLNCTYCKDDKNVEGKNGLLLSIAGKQRDIFHYLIAQGFDLNVADNSNNNILIEAVKTKDINVIKYIFFNYKMDINYKNFNNETALYYASFSNDPEIINFLLFNKANPNIANTQGDTPLHIAAKSNNPEICELLLKYGAKIDAPNSLGLTPFELAATLGNEKTIEIFLANNIAIKDNHDLVMKALKQIVSHGWHGHTSSFSKILHNYEKYLEKEDKSCLLLKAVKRAWFGNMGMISKLLQIGADINAVDKKGRNSLSIAICSRNNELAYMLMKYGINVNQEDNKGLSPFFYALKLMNIEIISNIIKKDMGSLNFEKYQEAIKARINTLMKSIKILIDQKEFFTAEKALELLRKNFPEYNDNIAEGLASIHFNHAMSLNCNNPERDLLLENSLRLIFELPGNEEKKSAVIKEYLSNLDYRRYSNNLESICKFGHENIEKAMDSIKRIKNNLLLQSRSQANQYKMNL